MGERTGGALRRGPDRVVGGVCAGLGHYFGVDPLLVRIVFVVLAIAHGIGILLYFVLWLLMEPAVGAAATGNRTLGERIREMGDEIREDFRTGFGWSRSSSTGQPAPPPPGATPPPPGASPPGSGEAPRLTPGSGLGRHQRGLWIGVILILLGAYFLLDNVGLFDAVRWDLFWPVVLIALGLVVLLRRH